MSQPKSNHRPSVVVVLAIAMISIVLLQPGRLRPGAGNVAVMGAPSSQPTGIKIRGRVRGSVPAAPVSVESSSRETFSTTPPNMREAVASLRQPAEPPARLAALLKQFAEQPNPTVKAQLLDEFHSWGRDHGEVAMDYALLKMTGQLRLDCAVEAWRGWAGADLASASSFVAQLLTPGHDYIVYSAAQEFARRDGAAAMNWAVRDVPAEYRPTAAQHVIMQWLRQDPTTALNWTAELAQGRERLNRAERGVLNEAVFYLAGRDLEVAADWVSRLPAGGALESGASALLDRWLDRDPASAVAWVESLSSRITPGALDQSYALFAERAAENNPATADAWARLISAEELRGLTLAQIRARSAPPSQPSP